MPADAVPSHATEAEIGDDPSPGSRPRVVVDNVSILRTIRRISLIAVHHTRRNAAAAGTHSVSRVLGQHVDVCYCSAETKLLTSSPQAKYDSCQHPYR